MNLMKQIFTLKGVSPDNEKPFEFFDRLKLLIIPYWGARIVGFVTQKDLLKENLHEYD